MPEYSEELQPEKDCLHVILSTLYPRQTSDMVQVSLKKRSASNTTPKDHMVELTPLMSKLIDEMVSVPSKGIRQTFYLESHGRAVGLLKIKSKFTKMRRKPNVHKEEIWDIMESILDINKNQEDNTEHQNEEKINPNKDLVMMKMI